MGRRTPISNRLSIRRRVSAADVVVGFGVVALLYGITRVGESLSVNVTPGSSTARLPTGLSHLPYYAACSLLRMFVALGFSTAFTFIYATAAARMRRAEMVLIPVLDILQSVPILGFLTFTTIFFFRLFGNVVGLEATCIFAVFTSQAWNMTFSFYHSLTTQPRDLDEAARLYRLTKWQRFWKLDVPSSMIGLVWNAMMSMGGGWFFLTAAEAITISGRNYTLPGMGSYIGIAIRQGSLAKVGIAVVVMIIMVVGVNAVFFRPLVAWAEKFRMEDSASGDKPKSFFLNLLRRTDFARFIGVVTKPIGRFLDRITRPFGLAEYPLAIDKHRQRRGDFAFWILIGVVVAWGANNGLDYVNRSIGFATFPYVIGLGALTFLRVLVVVALSTIIWVPVGVTIGMSARLTRLAQPVVQILASFPSNLLFPFFTIAFITLHVGLNIGSMILMMIGAQWYILFNAIAGAIGIPNDLREMATNFGLPRRQRWRKLILPAIFPAYVTGGITAAGGAWNASFVAVVVGCGSHHLSASCLGSYITHASNSAAPDHFAKVLSGVIIMSLFVVMVNRLFWRRLYKLAESHFTL